MKVSFRNTNKVDTTKNTYECNGCGSIFHWDSNSSWFGSYKDLEKYPKRIKYYCSDKCK